MITTLIPIQAMKGFEVNQFVGLDPIIAQHLICGLCKGVFNNPVDIECQNRHTFCSDCASEWLRHTPSCAICEEPLGTGTEPKVNHSLKNIINELNIRCFTQTNGCKEVIKLSQLSDHLENCRQYLCDVCELQVGKREEHNCLQLMKNERNRQRTECEKERNQLNAIIHELNTELGSMRENTGSNSRDNSTIIAYPDYIMFGTYITGAETIVFNRDSIKLTNVVPNSVGKRNFKYHILIPFVEMKQLLYCTAPALPFIFIKPTNESNVKIQMCMDLGKRAPNGLRFDINSNDPREQYIIINLKEKIDDKFATALNRCSNPENREFECSALNVKKAKRLLIRSQNRNMRSVIREQVFQQLVHQMPQNPSVLTTPPTVESNPTADSMKRKDLSKSVCIESQKKIKTEANDSNVRHTIPIEANNRAVMPIFVSTLGTGVVYTLDVKPSDTIAEVMNQIEDKEGVPVEQQRLIYADQELEFYRTVAHYDILKESTIHLFLKIH